MSNKPITDALKIVLADSYALYLKTHNYHWNVEGMNFISLHEMFAEQYKDLALAVDDIAERIRALGEKAPGSFEAFSQLTGMKPADENLNSVSMIKDLIESQETIIESLKKVMAVSKIADDEVTFGLVTERMNIHEKTLWMLNSTSK